MNRGSASMRMIAFAALGLALPLLTAARSDSTRPPPPVTAASVYVLDAADGDVLYRKGNDTPARLHSLTKLVTAAVLVDTLGDRLSETVTITPKHLTTGATAGLRAGDVWTLSDLLAGMLLVSGNDAANAIADAAGSAMLAAEGKKGDPTKRFVKAMNDLAGRLGAKSARFLDPSGLSPKNVAPARDMAAIGATIFRDARLQPYWRCRSRTLSIGGPAAREIALRSTVEVLGQERIIGAKTGSHLGQGIFNLIGGWLAPNGDPIIVVLFGSTSNDARYADFRAILAALPKDYPALGEATPLGDPTRMSCAETVSDR